MAEKRRVAGYKGMTRVVVLYALDAYLGIVAGGAEASEFLEVRRRTSGGMATEFHPVEDREAITASVHQHAPPRRRLRPLRCAHAARGHHECGRRREDPVGRMR